MLPSVKAILLLGIAVPAVVTAQEAAEPRLQDHSPEIQSEFLRLDVEARVDYGHVSYDGHTSDSQTGFDGRYILLRADGRIADGWTYSWRQRFNKNYENFKGTDWLYVDYTYRRWNFNGGKEVVAIGGYEYDRVPTDVYGYSVFWSNIACFQYGASVGYAVSQRDRLTVQVSQSPFATDDRRNMYGYNLMWNGSHGWFEALWSVNLLEYAPKHYISYISLGSRFTLGKMCLELDLMNRAASHQAFWVKDCSVVADLGYRPTPSWRIFGKYTYDVNRTGTDADLVVLPGTELNMAGGGIEFYPLATRRSRLRVHACCFYSWGSNASPDALMKHNTVYATAGLTWDMNFLNIKRK